jgi:hypothetical protein
MLSLLLMMPATILFGGAISVESRTMNGIVSFKSGFIADSGQKTGNEDRRKSRGLATSTMSKAKVSDTDEDSTTTSTATDDKLSSANKGSIASRTSSFVATKETSISYPESMGIHFVKPETVAPSVAPPITTKNPTMTSSPSIAPNSTSTSSSTPATKKKSVTSPLSSPPVPARTSYPTAKNVESIASRSSTMDASTRVPLSSTMEFDNAKTVSPSTLKSASNSSKSNNSTYFANNTSESSVDSDTTGEFVEFFQ